MSLNLYFNSFPHSVNAEFNANTTGFELKQIIANNLKMNYDVIIAPKDITVILCGHTVDDNEYPYIWLQDKNELSKIPNGHFTVKALAPIQPAALASQPVWSPAAAATDQEPVPLQSDNAVVIFLLNLIFNYKLDKLLPSSVRAQLVALKNAYIPESTQVRATSLKFS